MTFELVDLEELGEKALQDFSGCVGKCGETIGARFDQAIASLVVKVEFAYGVAAKMAHREQTLEGTAAIWAKMVSICDEIAREIKRFETQQPPCKSALDRILDFRNAADRRRHLHS